MLEPSEFRGAHKYSKKTWHVLDNLRGDHPGSCAWICLKWGIVRDSPKMTMLMETLMNQWMKWGTFFSDKPTIKVVGGLTTHKEVPPSYKLVYKPH